MRILVVEDEAKLLDIIKYMLSKEGYIVDGIENGLVGEDMALTGIYDVIVLDRMLPDKEGVEILKKIRQDGIITPVLLLTAKDTIQNRVEGLDAGADDYLVKPFSKEELLARVRALSRRSGKLVPEDVLSMNDFVLHTKKNLLCLKNGEIVLTKQESALLELFMRNLNLVLSKEQIFDKIWGFEKEAEISNVELYVHYLRKKILFEENGLLLETIRGTGYQLKEKAND